MPKFKQTLPAKQIEKWIQNGMSMSEVARRLNKSVGSISNFCKKHSIKSNFSSKAVNIPVDEAYKLYQNGVSMYKLGEKYNRPPSLVKKKLLKKYPDLCIRDMDSAKRPELLNDPIMLADEMKCKSLRRIAKELKVKVQTVSSAAKRLGLTELIRDQLVTDKPEDIRLLYESGLSLTSLADIYNTYPTTISNIIKRAKGATRPSGGVIRDSKYDELNDKEWLKHQYHDLDRSMAFIAAWLGTSIGNVSHALDKHGILKKPKRKVYSKLRRKISKHTLTTKWGTWKLQSKAEIEFVNNIPQSAKFVEYEPETLEYNGVEYTPDFRVDGEYIEIKPPSYACEPGVDRQRFVKQLCIANKNNIAIKPWYNGKFLDYKEIEDIDKYFALNWKVVFDSSNVCFEFLKSYGFRPVEWNKDFLLGALNKLHSIPENQWLNANYQCSKIIDMIRHFNPHFWSSTHKGYNTIKMAFEPGNQTILKQALESLWEKKRNINIYGLVRIIAKKFKDFAMVSIFKPWVAKHVYNKLLPDGGIVIDPCMGWGGRFLGTIGYDIKYIGYDLNNNAVQSNTNLVEFVGSLSMHDPDFSVADSSVIDWPDGDLLFTSPPYDDTEYYDGLKEQCRDTTPIYENIMRFKEKIALNIPKRHTDKCVEIAEKHGRKLIDMYKMRTSNFMGRRESTFEPILIFDKLRANGVLPLRVV